MPVDCYVPGTGIYQTLLKLTDRVSSKPDVMEQVGKGRIPILKEYFLYSTERKLSIKVIHLIDMEKPIGTQDQSIAVDLRSSFQKKTCLQFFKDIR